MVAAQRIRYAPQNSKENVPVPIVNMRIMRGQLLLVWMCECEEIEIDTSVCVCVYKSRGKIIVN